MNLDAINEERGLRGAAGSRCWSVLLPDKALPRSRTKKPDPGPGGIKSPEGAKKPLGCDRSGVEVAGAPASHEALVETYRVIARVRASSWKPLVETDATVSSLLLMPYS